MQDKNQISSNNFKMISDENESRFDVTYRGAETQIMSNNAASTIKLYPGSNGGVEDGFVRAGFKVHPSKVYNTVGVNPTAGKTKPQTKENLNAELKEKEPELWDGPLSVYNTFSSTKAPKECLEVIKEGLEKLESEKLIDWEIGEYNVFGRMYHKFDMSEFMVSVYIASDSQYKSVIEIRRSSGDTFVHDEFFRRMSLHLEEKSVLKRKEDEQKADFSLSLELEPLSFDNLADINIDELALPPLDELTTTTTTTTTTEVDTTSIQKLGDELIEVVTNRSSYREVFRHSSGVLCQELETKSALVQYVASQKSIVERLIKPLTEDLYDTLIIRNILQVVKQLLQIENPRVSIYENCAKDIRELQEKWTKGPQHQAINMRFGRSQQIERACLECLDVLKKRF